MVYELCFDATNAGARIEDLSAIVGGEKVYLGSLQPGGQRQGAFRPGPADDRQLHLLFREAGQRRLWLGPATPAGTAYRIEVRLLDDHAIRYRRCTPPCELSHEPWIDGRSAPND